MIMITRPTTDQRPELNKIDTRPEGRLTLFRTTQKLMHNTKCATTKDSLFYGQKNNCVQTHEPPTVKGQFDDAEDSQDIDEEEKDVALTLLNASKISAAGYAKSITSDPKVIDNKSANKGESRTLAYPVSLQYHRSQHPQHPQHQYYDTYPHHQRRPIISIPVPSSTRVLNYKHTPNEMPSIKCEEMGERRREAMPLGPVHSAPAGMGATMGRHAGPAQLSSISSLSVSHSAHKGIDRLVWEGSDSIESIPIYNPNPADVLFGRGGAVNTHPGNVFFRSQVIQYHNQYTKARNHAEKSRVVSFIRDAIKRRGGRFLKCKTASKIWFTVDERDATVKTMQSLRDVKTSNEAGESLSGSNSHSTEPSGAKTDANESNTHHENTDGNLNRNGSAVPASMVTNTTASSTTIVNRRLASSSLPSKKRPIKLDLIFAKARILPSREFIAEHASKSPKLIRTLPSRAFVEHPSKRPKLDLTTCTTPEHAPAPPIGKTKPTQEISFITTATPGRDVKAQPLKKVTFNKESSPSSNGYINNTGLCQQQQQKQQIFHQEQQFTPMVNTDYKNITLLRPEDVLSGRGGGTNRHPGNIHFRHIVSKAQPNYIKSRKKDKSTIARNIVQSIRQKKWAVFKISC